MLTFVSNKKEHMSDVTSPAISLIQIPELREVIRQELQGLFDKYLTGKAATAEPESPMSIEQAAKLLGITKGTLYCKVSEKAVPFHKKGKKVYFYASELNDYIRSGKRASNREIDAEASRYTETTKK